MTFLKRRKLAASIGTAITSLMLIIGAQSVNLSTAASTTSEELVYNGGFELDPLVDHSYSSNKPNPNITGWIKSHNVSTSVIQISNFPQTGKQGLALAGGLREITYISQIIPTIPGKYYELTYYLASTEAPPSLNNQFQTIVNEQIISDQTNVAFQPYQKYKSTFKAEGASTEIKFGIRARYHFLYLDNVSVKQLPDTANTRRHQ